MNNQNPAPDMLADSGMDLETLLGKTIDAVNRANTGERDHIEGALDAGEYLNLAKAQLPHGDWMPWLDKCAVEARTARRWMQLAKSGMKFDTVSNLGGIIPAIQQLQLEAKRRKHLEAVGNPSLFPPDKYALVLADPPWRYNFISTPGRRIENQYPTLTDEELADHPIQTSFAPDCLMYMWAPSPKLRNAMTLLEAWGFEYITHAVWTKDKIGMGFYFRQQHEDLLLGRKGNPPNPLPETRRSSVFKAPRTGHSVKPAYAHEMLEEQFPALPKLELFGRTAREGWTVWGNEV